MVAFEVPTAPYGSISLLSSTPVHLLPHQGLTSPMEHDLAGKLQLAARIASIMAIPLINIWLLCPIGKGRAKGIMVLLFDHNALAIAAGLTT